MDVFQDDEGYWFRFAMRDGRVFTGGPYPSHAQAERAGSAVYSTMYRTDAYLARPTELGLEQGAIREVPLRPVARVGFEGTPDRPYEYARSGIPVDDLKRIVDDFDELFQAVRLILAVGQGDDYNARESFLSSPQPGIRLRSGSVWVQLLADIGTPAASVVTLGVTLIKGLPFIATLPGKTRAAWYSSNAEASEAKIRALNAAERLRDREGAKAVVPGQGERPPSSPER